MQIFTCRGASQYLDTHTEGSTMLRDLRLYKYRGFESYEVADLARVNLLVGKNNCGKTSLIEAIHFLVARGHPSVLTQIAQRRGEAHLNHEADVRSRQKASGGPDISHFFFRHHFKPGVSFSLSSDNGYRVSVKLVTARQLSHFEDEVNQPFGLRIEGDLIKELPVIPVTQNGSLVLTNQLHFIWSEIEPTLPPVQFITPESLNLNPLRTMWDHVLITGRESEVLNALQILEEDLQSIHFLTGDFYRKTSGSTGVLLGFRGNARRVPIGSYGDGMRRLLALALSLIQSANGFLLIDEIDTGLHWTVMEDMWKLVVKTARESSIQVFATTHSYDCIRGLASLIESEPDLAPDISIQKVDTSLEKAVSLDAEKIQVAILHDIEVR